MLENRSCRLGFAQARLDVAYLRIVCIAFLLTMVSLSVVQAQNATGNAQAQKLKGSSETLPPPPAMQGGTTKPMSGGTAKPLPAKSTPIAFYTPEGQQQIADAILTEAVGQLVDQSDEHFEKGEYNHCINLLRIVVQGNPRRVDAFSDAAYLLWSTSQNDAAVALLKTGLAANPDDYYMYDELGAHFYYRLKDYPNAVTYYEKAIKYNCPFFTWSGLAHSYEKLNQWDKAVKAWETACNYVTKGGPGDSNTHNASQTSADQAINATMKHNLARAKAELAKRQKQ